MRRKITVLSTFSFRFFASRRVVSAFVFAVCFGWALLGAGVCDFVDSFGRTGSSFLFAQDVPPLDASVLDDAAAPNVAVESDAAVAETAPSSSSETASESTEPSAASDSSAPTSKRADFLQLALAGGWIGAILLVASILAVSLAIRLCLTLRRSVFAPPALEATLAGRLFRDDVDGAFEATLENNSFLGRVAAVGLREADRGWNAVEKALEDAIAEETAALYRKTEPLATIGNVAPMLGLLGTVVGMVATFGELAVADAGGRNLANGIYFALVTTVDGLIVAIPVLVVHSFLNGRVAKLVAETSVKIDKIFAPIKRRAISNETARPSRAPQESQASRPSQSPQAESEPIRRPTATRGLEEVTPPRASRPSLSLKPKQNE